MSKPRAVRLRFARKKWVRKFCVAYRDTYEQPRWHVETETSDSGHDKSLHRGQWVIHCSTGYATLREACRAADASTMPFVVKNEIRWLSRRRLTDPTP